MRQKQQKRGWDGETKGERSESALELTIKNKITKTLSLVKKKLFNLKTRESTSDENDGLFYNSFQQNF